MPYAPTKMEATGIQYKTLVPYSKNIVKHDVMC
jgi:hypothetical protein